MKLYIDDNAVRIRKLKDITIIFYDRRSIYVKYKGGVRVFHRWFTIQRNFYTKNFEPFRRTLAERKTLDFNIIVQKANYFEIEHQQVKEVPSFKGREVIYYSPEGRTGRA